MPQDGNIDPECEAYYYGTWQVHPAGTEGVCMVIENIGWDLGKPHADLFASTEVASRTFQSKGEVEAQVSDSIVRAFNRILARNMAYAESTIQMMLSSVRESVALLQEGSCEMAEVTLAKMYEHPDGRVADGMDP